MNCKYVQADSYSSLPRCTLTDNVCPFMYRCTQQIRWLPLKGMDSCLTRKSRETNIPGGACKVRFKKNNLLYVEYEDSVVTIPFEGEQPDYVVLESRDGELQIMKTIKY